MRVRCSAKSPSAAVQFRRTSIASSAMRTYGGGSAAAAAGEVSSGLPQPSSRAVPPPPLLALRSSLSMAQHEANTALKPQATASVVLGLARCHRVPKGAMIVSTVR